MKIPPPSLIISIFLLTSHTPSTEATNWSQFRGPIGQSVANGQSLPENFGPNQNELWKTELPLGHSSPCIWGDRIFLTAFDSEAMELLMIGMRPSDGKVLWTKSRPLRSLQRYAHAASAPSVSTPCTDGTRIVFLFGDFGLVVTDFEGKQIWEKQFIPHGNDFEFGYGASPVLVDGKLLINCDGGVRPGLLCLDI